MRAWSCLAVVQTSRASSVNDVNLCAVCPQLCMLDSDKDGEKTDESWVDLSDEDSCNWMMFVRPAQNHLEQNLVAYQYGSEIFYTTIKNIQPKQELKVGLLDCGTSPNHGYFGQY